MWMGRTTRVSARSKPINQVAESNAFLIKIADAVNDELVRGRGIGAHWLGARDDESFNHPAYQSTHQHTRRVNVPQRHFKARRAVSHRLRGGHFPPLPFAIRPKPPESILHFHCGASVEQVSHSSWEIISRARAAPPVRSPAPTIRLPTR